jgi:hypothetical protein
VIQTDPKLFASTCPTTSLGKTKAALQREEAIAELAASGAAAAAGGGAAGEDGAEGGGAALPQKLRRALVRLGKDGARREGERCAIQNKPPGLGGFLNSGGLKRWRC